MLRRNTSTASPTPATFVTNGRTRGDIPRNCRRAITALDCVEAEQSALDGSVAGCGVKAAGMATGQAGGAREGVSKKPGRLKVYQASDYRFQHRRAVEKHSSRGS